MSDDPKQVEKARTALRGTTDEYLFATQGAGIEGAEIVRRGGRTTQGGWTDSLVAPPGR